jgi:hypothetical protein
MSHFARAAIAAALLLGAGPALAQSGFAAPGFEAKPVDDGQLRTIAGKTDLAQIANAQNSGTVAGNTINGDSQTGTIRFDASSFQGMNGLSILSANTGNNVAINSAMSVNVTVHP